MSQPGSLYKEKPWLNNLKASDLVVMELGDTRLANALEKDQYGKLEPPTELELQWFHNMEHVETETRFFGSGLAEYGVGAPRMSVDTRVRLLPREGKTRYEFKYDMEYRFDVS
jgi:hypothetical protein